ncbi:MAG: response regulator transcription factor [Candidatus Paceibacterota bacterium]
MSSATGPFTVVVADDAEELRSIIIKLLKRDSRINVVGEASETITAIEAVMHYRPDVLLLDLSMPNGGGIRVLEKIKEESLPTRVVVLSGLPKEHGMYSAGKSGAHSYLEKGSSFHEIIEFVIKAATDV